MVKIIADSTCDLSQELIEKLSLPRDVYELVMHGNAERLISGTL